jgi:hypothetical protein
MIGQCSAEAEFTGAEYDDMSGTTLGVKKFMIRTDSSLKSISARTKWATLTGK